MEGRRLVLGGVAIQHELGLDGWSDADVLLHAVMDALLGAAGLDDIGHQFPPGDPRFAGASSLDLLGAVRDLLVGDGWRVANVDSTLIAEQPKLAVYLPAMRGSIANLLGTSERQVGIKATTNEALGALGRQEGIAAVAVALLERDSEG